MGNYDLDFYSDCLESIHLSDSTPRLVSEALRNFSKEGRNQVNADEYFTLLKVQRLT